MKTITIPEHIRHIINEWRLDFETDSARAMADLAGDLPNYEANLAYWRRISAMQAFTASSHIERLVTRVESQLTTGPVPGAEEIIKEARTLKAWYESEGVKASCRNDIISIHFPQ